MKYFKILIVITSIFLVSNQLEAQKLSNLFNKKNKKLDLYEEQVLDFSQYKNNTGKVLFSNDEFERELPESKYITSYKLGDKLAIRAFMKNSPANCMMLQLADSGEKIKNINKIKSRFERGYMIWKMYFDEKFITNTTHAKDFDNDEFSSLPTQRADIKDDSGNFFGEGLYKALLRNEELLTPGTHKLKIELVPMGRTIDFEFAPIATGEIDVIIPEEATYIKLDECFPKSKMTNPKIEKEIADVVNSNIVPESKLRDIIISSSRWTILRDHYKNPIKKSIRAYMVFSDNEGKIFYYERIFEKVFDGVEYSPMQISSDISIKGEGAADSSPRHAHSKCAKLFNN